MSPFCISPPMSAFVTRVKWEANRARVACGASGCLTRSSGPSRRPVLSSPNTQH